MTPLTETEKKKRIERILKLFALGDASRNMSEAEAELAATKARQLMLEYQLTNVDLTQYDAARAERVIWSITRTTAYTLTRPFALYDDYIGLAVMAITGTRCITTIQEWVRVKYYRRQFIGTESDTAIAARLFMVLLQSARAAARRRCGPGWKMGVHGKYAIGYAVRLASRAEEANPAPQTSTALVLRDKAAAIDDWMKTNLSLTAAKEEPLDWSDPNMRLGYADAGSVDLTNPRRKVDVNVTNRTSGSDDDDSQG